MSSSLFYEEDLPRAEQVIAAPVEAVFDAIDAVEAWPEWLGTVTGPVREVGRGLYELTRSNGTTRRVVVTARGPTHTIAFDIDGLGQLAFRTRPTTAGTRVEAIGRPVDHRSWRRRLRGRKLRQRDEAWLAAALDDLAAHLGSN